ncbi:MAG: ATP-dependent Clp protease adaptor ClpS [Flavobacteriales bacterium]
MNTETLKETSAVIENQELKLLVLFNDDVNTFDHVINMLIKYCGHDSIQAEQCAMLVHFKGKCDIKKGAFKELAFISEILAENGLTVEIN